MADEMYNRKLESLQQYIPFLDNMIAQLKDPNKKNREQQLNKMQSLHAMITDKRKKLKLETLIKCEDVISKLYEKVHNKPIGAKKIADNFMSTPASPSPPREIIAPAPLTIPTERLEDNRVRRIDIYSSAGESLNRQRVQQSIGLGAKVPDMSKPPISLEDLKTLEEDVQEKINEVSLHKASLYELNNLREKITEQIQMEEVLSKSPQKHKEDLESINTTVRNNLNLTKKLIQPPDKSRSKEIAKLSPNKPLESSSSTSSPKKEVKQPAPIVNKSPKILKEPASIFGSILSHIDDQILEGKKKKEERRTSVTGKDEKKSDKDTKKKDRKHSISKEDTSEDKKDKDAKRKERSSSSTEEKNTTKEEKKSKGNKELDSKKKDHHQSGDKSKSKVEKKESDTKEENKKEDKHKHSSTDKTNTACVSLTGKTSFEAEEERVKKELESKNKDANVAKETVAVAEPENKNKDFVGKITVKKSLAVLKTFTADSKEEDLNKQTTFKRLADKYNPKPKKPIVEQDLDKEVSDIIEENMKTSPPKPPVINKIPAPIPPPASLLLCSQMEPEAPEPVAAPLPAVLQNILNPSTTELINTVVSQLRQNNAENENRNIPPMRTPSVENFVSDYARDDNFVSEYTKEDFSSDDFTPSNVHLSDFNNFQPQSHQPQPPATPQVRRERLNFEPPTNFMNNQFNQMNHQNQRFMSPLMSEGFNDNFSPNRPFTPMPQGFSQNYNNFQPNKPASSDIQSLDYYPPNAPIPSNQYNCGPPLLSPEIPHFHNEQKPVNFGMMPNHDLFGHSEDMRWRQEDTRFQWDRRDQDHRMNRDPRTYREYREMRESRDPRVTNRDPRDNREQRELPRAVRDPRVNRDLRDNREPREREPRERDPRLNKDRESRDFERDRPRFRDNRSQNRDARSNTYDTKFDRMYSRTNRDRSRSRSRSRSYAKETFTSPLDSLYSGKEEHKTGKGYGVQNFRIPKVKKEEEEKEQSTKVSSTNEEVSDAIHSINDDSNDSINNEVTGNDVDTEIRENTEQEKEEVTKENATKAEPSKVSEANNVQSNEINEKCTEVDKTNEEPPKLQNEMEDMKMVDGPKPTIATQPLEQEQAKPADQTILAQFFANLLGSQNKKEKKTALYSLISTFSDSFSEKELSKITKIIKADEDAESSEEEEVKKPEPKPETEVSKEPEKEVEPEEVHPEDSTVKTPKRKSRRRIRRISSTASVKDEKDKEEEVAKTPEPPEISNAEEESVVVSVGERIKSRKRTSITPPKPKKKCKTELDMLHEDIQDMFIRDGVLTASGKRMCRLLKSDPNALTTPQPASSIEPPKTRRRPGPKPKPKSNQSEMKTMKNISVIIPKMPDISLETKENPRRSLRNSTKAVYAESDDDDNSAPTEEDSVVEEGSFRGDDSDAESTDTEKDKLSQTTDNATKTKATKRKRGKGWASGNIPSSRKKKKKQSAEESTEKVDSKSPSATQSDSDKSFVVPDKNYYIDFVTNKSHQCRLCDYHGRFITTHYKSQHPESEILTSRFSPAVAQEAIEDSKKNMDKYESMMKTCGSGKFHFTCRFCAFNTSVPPTIFYDHITTHTGEYRHICPMCDFSASSGKTLKSHMSNIHNNIKKRVARKSYSQTIVFGYMCGECNYVQMTQKNVEDHINIFHLQKPNIFKVNMSTTLDPEMANLPEKETKNDAVSPAVEEETSEEPPAKAKKNKADKSMLPPQPRKHPKAAPKSVKERLKAKRALAEKEGDVSDSSSVAESESSCSTEPEKIGTPEPVKPKPMPKRRLTREVSTTSEEEVVVTGRSRRAAKDKAAEKLKTLMEQSENGGRKKSSATEDDEKNKTKEVAQAKTNNERENKEEQEDKAKAEQKLLPEQKEVKPLLDKKEVKPTIKKEIELNVFTCKTDIQEENKKIEQERLQLMDELNKSVGNRTSLNFVDKLCNRLSNNDIIVKQEPRDDLTDSLFPSEAPLTMPVLEKNLPTQSSEPVPPKTSVTPTPPPKKPVLETEDMQVSNPSFDNKKNNKLITDMIQKLKGKMANISDEKSESSMTAEDADYDSEGPPPLTHVNKLPNVKPADCSTKTMLIGGLMKVIKYPDHLTFSCLVPPCLFSTKDQEAFQKHCSEAHKLPQEEKLTLCDMCGLEMVATEGSTFLESVFKHALEEHSDFMEIESKPEETTDSEVKPPRQLRLRKLSGDALSIIKKDWEEEIDKTTNVSTEKEDNNENQDDALVSEIAVSDTEPVEEPAASVAELEVSDDNPFPFKIAGVMSLAEPVPPLAPINKPTLQMQTSTQLIVKEAKLSQTELSRPKKTSKAMAKFIASVSDLYKCPHYYCLFSTNFRDFLEKHLKAHKVEQDVMIPCVYCDLKTPWEHVPMHIDIRHAHCRFACSYCMYRAVLKEYVFLHQDQMHPENDYSVIALPQPKHSKKWAIADVKVDPKSLCEPYRCIPMCSMEFLFENEFKKHLQDVHKTSFIACGYKNCAHRVQAYKMSSHWSLSHGVSIYQCGHCKMNANDIKQMYKHFALFHQGLTPDILVRKHKKIQEGVFLGCTPEAFSALRKIITIPSNISGENKGELFEVEPATVPVILPSNTVPYGVPTKATLQVVTSLSQNMPKSVIIPGSKSVINRTITLVTSNSPTSSGNILLLPSSTTGSTLSGIVMSPQANKQITSVAPISKTVKVVPSGHNVATAVSALQEISVQKDNEEISTEKDTGEVTLTIEPLEHITLSEDNSQSIEETETCEADPLSLEVDADIDASKSADSSGDESDKDKSKKEAKSGLMSYQLYRCSFCDISFSNSVDFKRHATFSLNCRIESQVAKPFVCVHCGKQLKNPHVLVEHVQCHGVLRFTCSLCGNKFATIAQTRNHIKNRHNITHTSLTPLNPAKQNVDLDEFVVRPKLILQMGAAKDAAPAEPSASASASENVYTPETIDQIPMRHILSSSIKCGLCSYTTKVRTNMVRHLQFHSEEKTVPDTAPVNPVPCLEKNEKMFDKMINLASSSHANSRMGGAKPDAKEKETESYPEFVPSHCRYVCCAHGCSYICPEEGNLRHHLIALHDSESSFTCVHCKADLKPTDADSLLKHFKLHGLQLYKCPYCPFLHNLRHKVEKHVSDNHPDLPVKITTVRFMESEPKDNAQEPSTSTTQSTPVPPPTTKVYKPWRCCMCKYKSGTQDGIENHVLEKHEVDSQFKCALCAYKTNDKETFADHFKTAHDNQSVDIIYAYRKMEEDKEKESDTFDTTPLWQRDRPRVRHIRGILFDESSPAPTKSPKKVKSAAATPTPGPSSVKPSTPIPGPSGVKSTTSSSATNTPTTCSNLDMSIEAVVNGTADILKDTRSNISDDFFHTVNKLMRESTDDIAKVKDSMVIVIEDEDEPKAKDKDNKNAPVAKNRVVKRKGADVAEVASKIAKISDDIIDLESSGSEEEQDEFSERSLKLRFGGFGMPLWRQFKCPVCNMFKSKRISDFVFHLFKEMKVFRFKCKLCPDESITYRYMNKHVNDHHPGSGCKVNIAPLPPNEKLLMWLQMVIREQSVIIVQNYPKFPQPVAGDGQHLVQCEFCSSKFHNEQEKNEHGVSHWTAKPYNCSSCTYTSYIQKDIVKHFKSSHEADASNAKEDEMAVVNGPTVEKLLKISDDQHGQEAEARMASHTADVSVLTSVPAEPTESQDPLADIPAPEEPATDPLDISTPVICDGEAEGKEAEAALSDSDLIIVTKTDSADVPTEGDVFCCEYCAFMTNSEVHVISHISGLHEHMHINFKKLNRATCENPKEHVGCSLCAAVGSEVRIRQHHMEKHAGLPMQLYRYQCALCSQRRRFLKFMGLKLHFNRLHQGVKMQYTSIFGGKGSTGAKGSGLKTYKCPHCTYVRNFKANAVNNIRQHVKQHFKAFTCGICRSTKYKSRADVLMHFSKEHPADSDPKVEQDQEVVENYNTTMAGIIAAATDVGEEPVAKPTARKSTSTPHTSTETQEYSFYGGRQEDVDMSKIMTSVEVNGMHLNMTAERLSKIFDLNVVVALEDCNLSVNLSSVFDS